MIANDDIINKLAEIFIHFPGIGPKQARRFVYYLLTQNQSSLDNLARLVSELKKGIHQCEVCFRFYPKRYANNEKVCDICMDETRDGSQLMLVEKDIDLENIKKLHIYTGKYFVLGGLIPILDKNPEMRIRARELLNTIDQKIKQEGLKEIIIALSVTREGDNTIDYAKTLLKDLVEKNNLKLSILGRGLSSGAEIEYIDSDTIKNALLNRH